MKFLVLVKDVRPHREAPDLAALYQAAQDYLNRAAEDGLLDSVYQYASGRGAVAIVDVGSGEQLWEMISAYPLAFAQEYEVIPLVDVNFTFDKALELLTTAA